MLLLNTNNQSQFLGLLSRSGNTVSMLNQIQNTISKVLDLRKGLIVIGLLSILVSGFVVSGGVRVEAVDNNVVTSGESGLSLLDCAVFLGGVGIGQDEDVGPCQSKTASGTALLYQCKQVDSTIGINTGPWKILVNCARRVGTDAEQSAISSCYVLNPRAVRALNAFYGDQPIRLTGDKETCKKLFSGFCSSVWDIKEFNQHEQEKFCKESLGFTEKPNVINVNQELTTGSQKSLSDNLSKCIKPTAEQIAEVKKKIIGITVLESNLCKDSNEAVFQCEIISADEPQGQRCIAVNKLAKESTVTTKDAGTTTDKDSFLGGIFTLIYRIIAAIIMALLFLVRYLQMMVLLLFISVMTVLLNLSPNTGFLTTLAVPLWSIFAQIASLGAVGILIFLGSATMIGIEGFEYEKTIEKGAKVAIYVFVSNFTYFGLAFAISLLDGFTKLIVFVFGGGSVFKLFEALIASVSSISKINNQKGGYALIPDIKNGAEVIGGVIFGKGGAGDITTNLVAEIIVVIGLALIIWVFGRIFFMLLTRVAILLLLLITSPIWVLGILTKDSLPASLKGQVEKAVSLVSGTIVFNFAFITTLVLVTIITQKINGGISEFQKTIADTFVPATNNGLAFIDGVSANAQTSGVLSNDAFLGFGAGGFGETISVCAVLGINLAIIYFAFDAIANLIDTNIQSVGKAVGGAVSKNLQNFRKADSLGQGLAMMGQDAFKYGSMAATGGNGLIGDAAGAGLKGVSMAERGVRTTARGALDGSLQKGMGRRFGAVGQTVKDLGKLREGNLGGLNVIGNLQKNLKNTSKGNEARNRAEALDKEIDPLDKELTNLNNAKNQNDDKLQDNLNQVEATLSGAAKTRFDQIKADNKADIEKLEQTKESIKQTRVDLAAEMAKEGKDINASSNAADPRVRKLIADEATSKQDVKMLEAKVEGNTEGERSFLQNNASPDQARTIGTLRSNSRIMKKDLETKGKVLAIKKDQRSFARLEEGHERLDILKQVAKNKKDKEEYKNGTFSGILNNAEVIGQRIDRATKMDNAAETDKLRKTVSNLKKEGKLTDEQVQQIESNLSPGKSDNEKALAELLKAIKDNSKTT